MRRVWHTVAVLLMLFDGPTPWCYALPHQVPEFTPPRLQAEYCSARIWPEGAPLLPQLPGPAASAPKLRLRGGSEYMPSASLLAQNPEMAKSFLNSKLVSKQRKYGFAVLALGLLLSALGFMFFFNRTLIGTGNLLTIGGVVLIAGHERAYAFLAQRERLRGSGIFLFGVFLVLRGRARLGVLVSIPEALASLLSACTYGPGPPLFADAHVE